MSDKKTKPRSSSERCQSRERHYSLERRRRDEKWAKKTDETRRHTWPPLTHDSHCNSSLHKSYLAIFICCAIKAVHVKVVSDLTTETFIAAFSRFVARRKNVHHMYSNNGTTFVGADKAIRNVRYFVEMDKTQSYILENNITWHFISPKSLHFSGLWEKMVNLSNTIWNEPTKQINAKINHQSKFTIHPGNCLNQCQLIMKITKVF